MELARRGPTSSFSMPDEPMRLHQLQSGRHVRLLSVVGVREGDQVGIRRMARNVRVVTLASVGHQRAI